MSPAKLRAIGINARRATRRARKAVAKTEAAGRRLRTFCEQNAIAHQKVLRTIDRERR